MMLKAIFPGSFDPPTNGHFNLIERASSIFDHLEIVIAVNIDKHYLFSPEERFSLITENLKHVSNVSVHLWNKLIVDFAKAEGIRVILRGVRALDDFSHEFELSMINKGLDPNIETFFMPTAPQFFVLRSSSIKELVLLNGDISSMVPPSIEKALKAKLLSA